MKLGSALVASLLTGAAAFGNGPAQWRALGPDYPGALTAPGCNSDVYNAFSDGATGMIVAGALNVCGRANATLFARYNGTDWSALGGALGDAVGNSGPGVGPYGNAFAFVGSRVVVGGGFSRSVAGTWLNNIGYMTDINSNTWLGMGPAGELTAGLGWDVYGVAPQGNDVALICGRFAADNAGFCPSANRVIKYNFTAGNWSCFGGDGFGADVVSIINYNGEIFAGGYFTQNAGATTTFGYVARYSDATRVWSPLRNGVNGNVLVFSVMGGKLWMVGLFNYLGPDNTYAPVSGLTAWNGTGWDTSIVNMGAPGTAPNVYALWTDAPSGRVLVGGQFGSFTTATGAVANNIAMYDTVTRTWDVINATSNVAGLPNTQANVNAGNTMMVNGLVVGDGVLYASGQNMYQVPGGINIANAAAAVVPPLVSATATPTATPSVTPSVTTTASITASNSATASITASASHSMASSPSTTPSPSSTLSASVAGSAASTVTGTPTATSTPSVTASPTASLSNGASASNTPTSSNTASGTASVSGTPSNSASPSRSSAATSSGTASPTASLSTGASASNTPTSSVTASGSASVSGTSSPSGTASQSQTASASPTASLSTGASPSASTTASGSGTASSSATSSASTSPTVLPEVKLTLSVARPAGSSTNYTAADASSVGVGLVCDIARVGQVPVTAVQLTGAYLHAVGSTTRTALDLAGQPVMNVTTATCAALSARLLRSLAATTTTAGETALDLSASISLAGSDARSSVAANSDAVAVVTARLNQALAAGNTSSSTAFTSTVRAWATVNGVTDVSTWVGGIFAASDAQSQGTAGGSGASSAPASSNTGLIVGLVVGLVGGAMLTLLVLFIIKSKNKSKVRVMDSSPPAAGDAQVTV